MYMCVFYEPLFLQSYCPLAHDDKEHLGHQGQTLVQGGDLGFSFGEWELGLCWDSSSQSSLALTFCKSLEQSSWFLIQVLGACPPASFLPFLSPPPGSPACAHPNQHLRPNPISSCTHLLLSHTHPALHAISIMPSPPHCAITPSPPQTALGTILPPLHLVSTGAVAPSGARQRREHGDPLTC